MNWGGWVGGGTIDDLKEQMKKRGVGLIRPDEGFKCLDEIMNNANRQLIFFGVEWSKYASA